MGVITKPIHNVPLNGSRVGEEIRIPGADYPTVIFEAETPVLAEDTAVAAEISADAAIAPEIFVAGFILMGLLYSARYFLVPLLKLIKIPGANWFSDFVNKVISFITDPIKNFLKGILVTIANGIEHAAEPITRALETGAWVLHDTAIELANFAASTTEAIATIVVTVIPREIRRELAPVKKMVLTIWGDIKVWNATVKRFGFRNLRTFLAVAAPAIVELRKGIAYVISQGHKSFAGALSSFQWAWERVKLYEETVRKLKFYDVPAWIRHVETVITKTIPQTIHKLALRVGKIEGLIKENALGIPVLMALMTAAARARWFRPAIPEVCTEVGDCAAGNLLGKSNWAWFKDLLGLLLAAAIDALVIANICEVGQMVDGIANEFIGGLGLLSAGESWLAKSSCPGAASTIPPPLYQTPNSML
jgi:hypothetical protein